MGGLIGLIVLILDPSRTVQKKIMFSEFSFCEKIVLDFLMKFLDTLYITLRIHQVPPDHKYHSNI